MHKFVKLINSAEGRKGNPIYINTDHISAIHEVEIEGVGFKTFVYGGYQGVTWEVEESPKQIIQKISYEGVIME